MEDKKGWVFIFLVFFVVAIVCCSYYIPKYRGQTRRVFIFTSDRYKWMFEFSIYLEMKCSQLCWNWPLSMTEFVTTT